MFNVQHCKGQTRSQTQAEEGRDSATGEEDLPGPTVHWANARIRPSIRVLL